MAPKRKAGGRKAAVKPSTKVEVVEEVKEIIEEEAPPPEAPESDKEEEDEKLSSKKAKTEEKKVPGKRGRKPKAATKPSPKKKATKDLISEPAKEPKAKASKSTVSKVIIEASKECNSIKIRAEKVQTGLKGALPGLEVLVNPDKPRKGCFEIRDQDGNTFLSLLGMPRPYTKLKGLDLDKTVEEIVAKIK